MVSTVMFQGVDKDSTAFKLMKQMGWEEGTGLGKDQQGIKQHVRVKKKNDNSGLGVDEKEKAARNWTFNTSTFDNILKNLKVVADPDLKEEKQQAADLVDEEQKTTKKTARPQGRYKRREGSKLVRGYSQTDLQAILGDPGVQSKPAVLGNAVGQIKAEADLPRPPKLRKVNVQVKEELIAQELKPVKEELDLKPVKQELMIVNNSVKQEYPGENLAIISQHRTILVKQEPLDCKPMQNILEQTTEVEVKPVNQEPLARDWWGNNFGFVRGGQLGSRQPQLQAQPGKTSASEAGVATNDRNAFCEQDQENLYNLVQDKATTGKQGLGIGDRPRKIGGAHYKGQKTTFQDDDEGGGSNGGADNQDSSCISVQTAEKGKDSEVRSSEHDQDVTGTGPEAPGNEVRRQEGLEGMDDGKPGGKLKWKKVCKEILQEAPAQTMSLKRLQKRLTPMLRVRLDQDGNAFDLRAKIEGSSQFRIDGKTVVLVSSKRVASKAAQ